jgi:hypothetical protein
MLRCAAPVRASLCCRQGRYNSGIGPSSALRCIRLDRRSRRTALFRPLLYESAPNRGRRRPGRHRATASLSISGDPIDLAGPADVVAAVGAVAELVGYVLDLNPVTQVRHIRKHRGHQRHGLSSPVPSRTPVVSGAHGVQHLVEAKVTALLVNSLFSVTVRPVVISLLRSICDSMCGTVTLRCVTVSGGLVEGCQ